MGKSNAERQAAYRARRKEANQGAGDRRLNTWVSAEADLALDRLAHHYGVTRRAMLERLITEADRLEWEALDPNSSEWKEYFDETE